jgi:Glucose-6-phosphate dehydrogenase subunit C-terminal domain
MTTSTPDVPAGTEVPFGKILETMARRACQDSGIAPTRALVATVVAVGPSGRLHDAAAALQALGDSGTVRGILISEGDDPAPKARVAGNTVAFHGLKPSYVNNAVAALRLSSLPTLVWWRGGKPETIEALADLADRIVLDEDTPQQSWAHAARLFDDSAFSDLRWARLTQWRALMAHFFDIPEVVAASSHFTDLKIRAGDRWSAELFAAWLTSSIEFDESLRVHITDESGGACLHEVRLGDNAQELVLCLAGRTCLETSVSVHGHRAVSRIVSLGDERLTTLIDHELRIRARDPAFERAVKSIVAETRTTDELRK